MMTRREAGPRKFELSRACKMDQIVPTITSPGEIRADIKRREIYFGSSGSRGSIFTVVLEIAEEGGLRFVSAYSRSPSQVAKIRASMPLTGPTGTPSLQKSEPRPCGVGLVASDFYTGFGLEGRAEAHLAPILEFAPLPLLSPPSKADRSGIATNDVVGGEALIKALASGGSPCIHTARTKRASRCWSSRPEMVPSR